MARVGVKVRVRVGVKVRVKDQKMKKMRDRLKPVPLDFRPKLFFVVFDLRKIHLLTLCLCVLPG